MATLTIRNVPEAVVERMKRVAEEHGRSMEQEVRELLELRYGEKGQALRRLRDRWSALPETGAGELAGWREEGRP